jgi:C1A family cysteine protease
MLSVSAENWENYAGGIFSCVPNALINHAVLLVGYDELTWLIKNQWGTSWG